MLDYLFTNKLFPSAVPSAPPDKVHVGMINSTSAFVRWQPPPVEHQNGVILGYKVGNLHIL